MSLDFFGFRVFILVLFSLFVLAIWFPTVSIPIQKEYLTVRFLDVGQGDSIHIETPDGYELLIDGGASSQVLRKLSEGRSFFDRKIDVVLATHPDTDHIGGLVDIFERYTVDYIIKTEAEHEAPAARAFARAESIEGSQVILAQAGQEIQLGASTTIRILSPNGDTTNWGNNNASIVVQVVYGDIAFMLTGDAPSSIEDYLVTAYGSSLESEVLKLGHHGSKTSTSENFLDTVQPEFAVVSASADNRYGHPHQSVIARVFARNIKTLSTATEGTIVFQSDGKEVWLDN
jgi:competence protein ComEC